MRGETETWDICTDAGRGGRQTSMKFCLLNLILQVYVGNDKLRWRLKVFPLPLTKVLWNVFDSKLCIFHKRMLSLGIGAHFPGEFLDFLLISVDHPDNMICQICKFYLTFIEMCSILWRSVNELDGLESVLKCLDDAHDHFAYFICTIS